VTDCPPAPESPADPVPPTALKEFANYLLMTEIGYAFALFPSTHFAVVYPTAPTEPGLTPTLDYIGKGVRLFLP
jgi:hypothetical protein